MTSDSSTSQRRGSRCHCTGLRKASRRISNLYDIALAPSGLKNTQRAILVEVGRSQPISVSALAAILVVDAGGLAHTLKPLVRDGLLAMNVDVRDKRNRIVTLTPAGRSILDKSQDFWNAAQASFERTFGKRRARDLRDAIAVLASDEFMQQFEAALKQDKP